MFAIILLRNVAASRSVLQTSYTTHPVVCRVLFRLHLSGLWSAFFSASAPVFRRLSALRFPYIRCAPLLYSL